MSREDEISITSIDIYPPTISDHSLVTFKVPGKHGKSNKKTISYRKLHDINLSELEKDIAASSFVNIPGEGVEELATQFENLSNILNKHAPLVEKEVVDRSGAPWYNDECKQKKTKKRKAERNYRKNKTAITLDILDQEVKEYKQSCHKAKIQFYKNKVQDCQGNQKELFRIVGTLLDKENETRLPSYTNTSELANNFALFFKNKIEKIRTGFTTIAPTSNETKDDIATLEQLIEVTAEELRKLTHTPNNKY